MKKIYILKFCFAMVISLVFNICVVKAETFTCQYDVNESKFNITFDNENDSLSIENLSENKDTLLLKYSYSYVYSFNKGEINRYDVGECPVLYVAENEVLSNSGLITTAYTYYIYSDAYIRQQGGNDCAVNIGDICLKSFFTNFNHYYTAVLSDDEINKGNAMVSRCDKYTEFYSAIENAYNDYSKCNDSSSCKRKNLAIANDNILKLKDFCRISLSTRDTIIKTSENEYIVDECVLSCNNLNESILNLQKSHGISGNSIGECGVSDRLNNWILNIIKWIKYILPVIVIIFGILDFIKAIGVDKDDEMKKAQGKFIKRLIAAALVFIVPFIIEFILEKMGFTSNSCGLW